MCLLLSVSVVRGSCLLASARSSAAWSAVSSRLPRVPRSLSAVLLAGMRWRCSPWRCVARLRGSRSSALGMRLARASGASRLSPWSSPLLRLARPRSGSRAVRCRPRWGSGWRRVRALRSSLVASRCRSRAGFCSRPCRAARSLRPGRLRLPASRSSSSVAGGILLCSLRCWRAVRGRRCSVARSSAASFGCRPVLCCPRGPRSAARRAAGCRGGRSRRLAVRLVLARRCSRAVRSARWASAVEGLLSSGRVAGLVRPLFSPIRALSLRIVQADNPTKERIHRNGDDKRNRAVNMKTFTHTPAMERRPLSPGVQSHRLLTASASAGGDGGLLKRRSSRYERRLCLAHRGGCDPGHAIGDCRRVFPLCHPVSRYLIHGKNRRNQVERALNPPPLVLARPHPDSPRLGSY